MMRIRAIQLLALILSIPAVGAAQVCSGLTPFAYGPVRLGGFALVGDNRSMIEAQAAGGAPKGGLFGSLSRRHTSYAGLGAKEYAIQAGYSVPLLQSGRVEGCPIAAWQNAPGADIEVYVGGDDETIANHAVGIGFSVGSRLISRPTFELIPFVSASLMANVMDVTYHNSTSTNRWTSQILAGGIGFVFEKQMTVRPIATVTMKDHVGSAAYGLAMTMAIPGGMRNR